MTPDEAAAYLRISRNTLYRWREDGVVKFHVGPYSRVRYRIEDLDAALATVGESR